jgi:deoxyribodipyrimidine photolyase-like uncharacterized protein
MCRGRGVIRAAPSRRPGYWSFLDRQPNRFAHNPRMVRQVRGASRLNDLRQVIAQEKDRGSRAL